MRAHNCRSFVWTGVRRSSSISYRLASAKPAKYSRVLAGVRLGIRGDYNVAAGAWVSASEFHRHLEANARRRAPKNERGHKAPFHFLMAPFGGVAAARSDGG